MSSQPTNPIIYVKSACPFCLKLRIFLTEAGLADIFYFVTFEDGDETHKALRKRMQDAGQEPSFPAAEQADNSLKTGSDDLITLYAREANIDPAQLDLLTYYENGVFPAHIEMFRKLQS
ncbi:hypothetical protein [Altericroceibacterium endophyticum]|uniref:Uncharacterized protein n=1 Tax=Altericroceibacterium endophyticum TaxID=1808508 RepID=A0A6I4T662_9SPHN|nr:hypothetical protein [Altericroceibacterium endophyticum]MXO66684.1 hypothetical protein [Altericroceibacterium endophyticum]